MRWLQRQVEVDGTFVDATDSADPSVGGAAGGLALTDRDLLRFAGQAQGSFFGFDPDHGTAVAVMINTAKPGPAALMGAQALTAAANG